MTDQRRITRALLSVSDKSGLLDFARGLSSHGDRTGFHRRHRQGAEGCRAEGDGCLGADRLSRDDGRPGEDAAPEGARRAAGDPRQHRARGGDGGSRHPADRPAGGQPLSVRGDGCERRGLRRLRGEHRHRRPGDDPRRGQEPRRRRRGGGARGLHRGAVRAVAAWRRDDLAAAEKARREGLCPHRELRRRDLQLVRADAGRSGAGIPRVRRQARRGAALRREPAPERGVLPLAGPALGRRHGAAGAGQAALLQQHQRHRRGL